MKKQNPEWFFSILLFTLGLLLLLITPADANADEGTYVSRIWEMALGHIMPNSYITKGDYFPEGFQVISFGKQVNLSPIDLETWKEQWQIPFDWNKLIVSKTRAVYFPTLFALQAVLMRLFGAHFHLPILAIYYILRFSYLITYCLLVFLCVKVMPFGKWVIGTIAIAPMCLIQAASISSDSINFGLTFLFIAWIVKIVQNKDEKLTSNEILITCLMIISIGTLKPNSIFLLGLLLVIPFKRIKENKVWLILLLTAIISGAISIIWSYFASKYFIGRNNPGLDSIANFQSLFRDPHIFLSHFWVALSNVFPNFYKQAIGFNVSFYLPSIIYWAFPCIVLYAIFANRDKNYLTLKQRVLIGLIGLLNIFMVFVIFFIVETPVNNIGIWGIQGRYFTPFFPLLILPFIFTLRKPFWEKIIGVLISIELLVCVVSLFLSYHVTCGNNMVQYQTCLVPVYKNWDPSTFQNLKLDNKTKFQQSAIIKCKELSSLQVWVIQNSSIPGQKESLEIINQHGNVMKKVVFSSEEISHYGWTTISFDFPLKIQDQEISFQFSATDKIGIPGLEFGFFPTNEFSLGSLWINGTKTENDLVFRYSCTDNLSSLLK